MKLFKYSVYLFIFIMGTAFIKDENVSGPINNGSLAKDKSKIVPFSELIFTDVGVATKPGKVNVNIKEVEVNAGGADIWGKNDEFNFGYTKIEGDFDVSVQIKSLSKPHQYTKAGIMARVDVTDNCEHVYFQVFPDNSPRNKNKGGCEFQYRLEKGGDMKAIYFNALVTDGSITLDPQEIILFQGEKSVTSLSYWADSSTGAALYCPDCNREVQAGGGITAAVYELPLWWDWSQPFTIRFQDQDIIVSGDSPCAAASLLGGDDAGLAALRGFRDRHLAGSAAGRKLISLYYRSSPRLIALLDQYPLLREAVRSGLTRFAKAFQ